jgi:HAE1 family hydrophobic/amphiphilic exporter-1
MEQPKEIRTNFFTFTTERPVAILMVVIAVVVFGYISYQQLALNLMPDMSYPSLTVRTEYPGTAPEEIETTISRPIEQALGVVDNLISISSISKAEQSDVILEFTWDTDMNKATADIREKMDQVFLPEDVKRPIILRYDPSLDPILRIGVFGKENLTYLRYLADEEIKRALETVEGVAAVKVKGGLEEEIRVELNEQKLTLIGMNIQQVRSRLSEENVNLAGGNLKEGETEYLVRTLNEFKTVDEIANVVIGRWNGVDIKVKDIGNVHRTSKEREIITRIAGQESVEIEIYKEADANIVDVARRIKEKIYGTAKQQAFVAALKEKEEKQEQKPAGGKRQDGAGMMLQQMTSFLTYKLPDDVGIKTLADQSVFIKSSVDEVNNTAIQGGLLAVIVLMLFLRKLGPTIIIGLSIPISIIATFAAMKMFHVSLNIMSLGGLALGVGMLVDNSIVVLESIARCRDDGDNLIRATIRGVSEVGSAVNASTLTTVAVFFPIVFVEGVAGQVFGDLALTVVFSLLSSLVVAIFLIPMLSSRQTETFIKETQWKRIPKQFILDFSIRSETDELLKETSTLSLPEKISGILTLIIKSIFLFLAKSLKVIAALIISVLKQSVLLVLVIVQPLMSLIQLGFYLSGRKLEFASFIKSAALRSDNQRLSFVDQIWNEYLVFKSVGSLYEAFPRMYHSIGSAPGWIRKIRGSVFFLFKAIFYILRYIATVILESAFRLIHAIIIEIGLITYFVALILMLILTLPFRAVVSGFNWFYDKVEAGYPRLIVRALEHKYTVSVGMLLLFLLSIFVIGPRLGSELIPEVHQGVFYVEMQLPIGTPVEKTDERIRPIEEQIAAIPGVEQVSSVSGTDKTATTESEEGEHTAKLTVTLTPSGNTVRSEERIIAEIRRIMSAHSGIDINIARPTIFSFKTPVEVHLKGYNLTNLQSFSSDLEERMARIPGLVDVKSNIQRGNPEVQIYYNRDMLARHNLNILNVASIVRNKVRGDVASEFKDEDRRIDILVRLREDDKQSLEDLRRIVINPNDPIPIPLQAVADIRVNEGPSEIRRIDQQRTAVITASLAEGSNLNEISAQIFGEIQKLKLPDDFFYEIAGQNKEMATSLNSLTLALALAIFLVYIVMAIQFESLVHPFVILFTIPMAMIGVIIFLYILQIPLSIIVFLGMIILAGIVVNNAIVLVDYVNHLRRNGMAKREALIKAGQVRLRPILMTTLTTVLGLLPMALGLGDGAEIRTPLAITVIIGLSASTVLTLVVIPTIYDLMTGEQIREAALELQTDRA